MTSFGLIRALVCVHTIFLLGVAGRNDGLSKPSCLTRPGPSFPVTVPPYAQVHLTGRATKLIVIDADSLDSSRPA